MYPCTTAKTTFNSIHSKPNQLRTLVYSSNIFLNLLLNFVY
uniref:Uncharacterized protein n=1 Tax=Podoviridae sp. ct8Lf7 TaxID=2827723 RepID=A0A8S5S0X0_9CAUD|nr:MAG TPA: hypothetical protein [Podoviridae sp. ct8Lf7]